GGLWIEARALAAGALASPWGTIDNLIRDMAAEIPALAPAAEAAPGEGFRLHGQKVARQPRGYSGRTAMNASVNVREPRPPGDPDSPLAFSMEGFQGRPPAALIPRYWSPGWNSVQALNKFQDEVGGPLTGGDPGRRLIDPAAAGGSYSDQLPDPFVRPEGEWLIVPLYHIFGSEELSAFSPPVMELAPAAYVALAPDDAAGLGAAAGSLAEVILPGGSLRLPVRIIDSLPEGTAGLPVYLPGLEGIVSPGGFARIRVMKQGRQELT
ncbi:MAG: NADH-quinone oxidoreductase subunit G, partial [Actinobacteria bacterium]|nr:NADH-quinone oxidoreductase subunit G [Actinomycetota bacterium]